MAARAVTTVGWWAVATWVALSVEWAAAMAVALGPDGAGMAVARAVGARAMAAAAMAGS